MAAKRQRMVLFTLIYGHEGLKKEDRQPLLELDKHFTELSNPQKFATTLGLNQRVEQMQFYYDRKNFRAVFSGVAKETKDPQALIDWVCDQLNICRHNGERLPSTWVMHSLNDLDRGNGRLSSRAVSGSSGIGR